MAEVWPDGTWVKTTEEVSKLCARIADLERCLSEALPVVHWCWTLQTPNTPRERDLGAIIGTAKRLLAEAGRGDG